MEASSTAVDVRDYLHVLSRRRRTILVAVLVVAGVAALSSVLQTTIYQANASVLLTPSDTAAIFGQAANASSDPSRDVDNQVQVILSQPVRQKVEAEYANAPSITAAALGSTDVIRISAESTDPVAAASVANAYATAYIAYRQAQDINDALDAETQIQGRIADLQNQIDTLNVQLRSVDQKSQPSVGAALTSEVDNLVQQQGVFKQQLGQLQVEGASSPAPAEVVDPASTTGTVVSPKPARSIALALVVGLVLGIGAAFVIDYFDDSVKSSDDLERVTAGFPVCAVIPRVGTWKTRDEPVLVSTLEPKSPAAEAYRALRTAVQFASFDRTIGRLQVTSPSAGDGKTTTLANLGVALAQVGQRVIVVCCDLRRPRLHQFFGIDNTYGLTSVIRGEMSAFAALHEVGLPGLRLLSSGPPPHNPAEMLSSVRTAEVLTVLQADADIILIDSPPVLPVTDAAVLSAFVDATLLVASAASTTRRQISQAIDVLGGVDAPLLGSVLNGVTDIGGYGSDYRYYRYDSHSVPQEPARRFAWRRSFVPEGSPSH